MALLASLMALEASFAACWAAAILSAVSVASCAACCWALLASS